MAKKFKKLHDYIQLVEDMEQGEIVTQDNGFVAPTRIYASHDDTMRHYTRDNFIQSMQITSAEVFSQAILTLDRKINRIHGIDSRTIGYLFGGYKDSVEFNRVQLFNTITDTGINIITGLGFQTSYVPGFTTKDSGYFVYENGSTDWFTQRFNYTTQVLEGVLASRLPSRPYWSMYDLAIGSTAYSATGNTYSGTGIGTTGNFIANTIYKFPTATETWVSLAATHALSGSTRQALNNDVGGFLNENGGGLGLHVLIYASEVVVNTGFTTTATQIATGLSKDNATGYIIGLSPASNNKVTYSGTTVLSVSTVNVFTYNFGESHSVQSEAYGFMMAGFNDTTGRFGGSQHGLCQKISWDTESTSTLSDLATPQSSGQMSQGF